MKKNSSYGRLAARHTWLIRLSVGVVCVVVVSVCAVYFFFRSQKNIPVALVLASDPVSIIFLDSERKTLTKLTIPAETYPEDSSYSLEALWHLGAIDPKDENRLQVSLRRAFGAPILWYIGPKTSRLDASVSQDFSFSTFFSFIARKYRTNMTFFEYLLFYISASRISSDRVKHIDVGKTAAVISQQLPDGTKVQALDTNHIDVLFGRVFEDSRIRMESKSIAIYNTTDIPSLGSSVARLLGHVGMVVTTVNNQVAPVEKCVLSVSETSSESKTSMFIQKVYGCTIQVSNLPQRADIILQLGNHFAGNE